MKVKKKNISMKQKVRKRRDGWLEKDNEGKNEDAYLFTGDFLLTWIFVVVIDYFDSAKDKGKSNQ